MTQTRFLLFAYATFALLHVFRLVDFVAVNIPDWTQHSVYWSTHTASGWPPDWIRTAAWYAVAVVQPVTLCFLLWRAWAYEQRRT